MKDAYRFNRDGLDGCCIAAFKIELYRRKEAGEPLMKDGDTLSCECGKRMICEPSKRDGQLRWGLEESAVEGK
jgi:hypothetical protein